MSTTNTKFSVLFNSKETIIELDLDQIKSYDFLIQQIISELKETSPSSLYQIMGLNTSESFALLTETNYMDIMKEKNNSNEILKLFMSKVEQNEGEQNKVSNKDDKKEEKILNTISNKDINGNENMDNNDDDGFEIETEGNNKNGNDKGFEIDVGEGTSEKVNSATIDESKNETNKEKEVNDSNENMEDKKNTELEDNQREEQDEDKKKIEISNNINLAGESDNNPKDKEIQENEENKLNLNLNEDNYPKNEEKEIIPNIKISLDDEDLIKGKIFQEENNNEENIFGKNNLIPVEEDGDKENFISFSDLVPKSSIIKKDTFKAEKCSVCSNQLSGLKYICCVCENLILCTSCELSHIHPCLKYKTTFISNMEETYKFVEQFHKIKIPQPPAGFSKLFKKEYELKLVPMIDLSICLRPNKGVFIPIKIENHSKETIKSSQFDIIIKNYKNLKINYEKPDKKFEIAPLKNEIIKIKCITPPTTCKEVIDCELFSLEFNLKNCKELNMNILIEVNEDQSEENMNEKLKNYETLCLLTKEHKQMILSVFDETNKNINEIKDLKEVYQLLIKNNWKKENVVQKLKANANQ